MQVKQALTGYGKADKKQIQTMVTSLLNLEKTPKPDDAADALAIALCHGFTGRFGEMYAVGNMTRAKGQNAEAASAYQALMQEGARKRKAPKAKQTQKTLEVKKRTKTKTVKPVSVKTRGAGTRSTAEDIAASVIKNMKD